MFFVALPESYLSAIALFEVEARPKRRLISLK